MSFTKNEATGAKKKIVGSISNSRDEIPLLIKREECLLLKIGLQVSAPSSYTIRKVKIDFTGTSRITSYNVCYTKLLRAKGN